MRGYHVRIVAQVEGNTSDTFLPESLFQPLPAHSTKSSKRRNTFLYQDNHDYRLGPIQIDWMDFEGTGQSASGKEKKHSNRALGHTEAIFVPHKRSKSGTTNLPEGTVHLFRDAATKPSLKELESVTSNMQFDNTNESDGLMLGVLAVPSWMTPSDFLAFVAPAEEGIAHLRLIRDFAPNRSIAVIRFPNPTDAADFLEAYNGKPFNSIEPEICHVVHILSVMVGTDDTISQAISRSGTSQGSIYELPTCPVCLERMDSAVTGLITVPCSHTFHCMCLSKWGDSRCPVCRYSQNLLSSHPTSSTTLRPTPFANPSSPTLSSCSSCSSTTNLWICLICGNIGCGRYGRAHAQAHYQETTHLYALELETQRVWDYAGDGYVHRLIQNKADGKLVELPSAASSMGTAPRDGGLGPSTADALSAEKIEAIGIEYSYLLTSQLDSQRSYYEDQMSELKVQVNDLKKVLERVSTEFEIERDRTREELSRRERLEAQRASELLKEKTKAENRAGKSLELARKFEKELKEEKAVSEGLMRNLANVKDKLEISHLEKQGFQQKVQELEDQVRDIMFFLEAKTKIEEGGGVEAEAAGGSIEIPGVSPLKSASARKKKGKKG